MESVLAHAAGQLGDTHFVWLEITENCQLECSHCYASSGPGHGHGVVTTDQWLQTLTEAAAAGVTRVQFIGGEPTSHPALPRLVSRALAVGLEVEVFSNLFSIREDVWRALTKLGVSLATSYYSSGADVHDQVTHRVGSHERTKRNIAEALRLGIPVRVGIIRLSDDQDIDAAIEELLSLGVRREDIGVDDQRGVGRGGGDSACNPEEELCGKCATGVLAIRPDGAVQPCVFSRDARFEVGNIVSDNLSTVISSERLHQMRDYLNAIFLQRGVIGADCPPTLPSDAQNCGPSCSPSCSPMGNCNPVVNPPPCNPIAGHPPRPEPAPRPPGPVCRPY